LKKASEQEFESFHRFDQARPAAFWVYIHIFEKQDKGDIAISELRAFKKLAKDFGTGGITGVETTKQNGSLEEICHDSQD
jgi:hypothetical protein